MAKSENLFGKLFRRRALKHWAQNAEQAKTAELQSLNIQREHARKLRDHLNEVIYVADRRIAQGVNGSAKIDYPSNASWVWRPELWSEPLKQRNFTQVTNKTALGNEAEVFHNCNQSELSVKQRRNGSEQDGAPYQTQFEVFKFDGSFLSLVLGLPDSVLEGLKKRHIFRMDVLAESEEPVVIFARLNVKHGPNTEQIVHELKLDAGVGYVEFDLAFTGANERRIEKMWLDLIFEDPSMNLITIQDLTMYRYPRAEM